jgi:hypothetical protein
MIKEKSEMGQEQPVLTHALALCLPLATWLIRHGVGHSQFAAGLKKVFFLAAEQELKKQDQKPTDSAISLMSGLHRKDVKNLKDTGQDESGSSQLACTARKPSVANQTFTRWLTGPARQASLPVHGAAGSFEQLVSSISKDVHHRAVLQELVRLGLVRVEGDSVELIQEAFIPKQDQIEAWQLMMASVTDHLSAGVHNLTSNQKTRFLEQSVFIDGLSPESAQKLNLLANSIWDDALQRMVQAATPLCDQGPGTQEYRFRLGIFSFTASVQPQSVRESK